MRCLFTRESFSPMSQTAFVRQYVCAALLLVGQAGLVPEGLRSAHPAAVSCRLSSEMQNVASTQILYSSLHSSTAISLGGSRGDPGVGESPDITNS